MSTEAQPCRDKPYSLGPSEGSQLEDFPTTAPVTPYRPHPHPDPLREFTVFTSRVLDRLHQGQQRYGEVGFTWEPSKLIGEIEEELFDVMGYGYILWCRLKSLKQSLGLAIEEPDRG